MKTNFIALVLIIVFNNYSIAQTHRFIYDVVYKKDSTSNITTKENYILDIGTKETKYYTTLKQKKNVLYLSTPITSKRF